MTLTEAEIDAVLDARSLGAANAAFSEAMNARGGVAYSTGGHTAADVSLHAFGAGADRFAGVIDNTEVGRRLAEAMGLALPEEQLDGVTRLIEGTAGDDRLVGGGAGEAINGGAGSDELIGLGGDDRLSGGRGDDRLSGRRGDDGLFGGSGRDRLSGGVGDDRLEGGGGSDAFIFRRGGGSDRILDFAVGEDEVVFMNGLFADADALLAASAQSGDAVLIALGGGGAVSIEGLSIDAMPQGAFIFE